MLYQILFLVLGWVLGLLSPVVFDALTKKRRQAEVRQAVLVELAEMKLSLASETFPVAGSVGAWDRDYLTWLKAVLESSRGARDAERQQLLDTVTGLLGLDDQQLAATARSAVLPASPALRKHRLPYLEANLEVLASLRPEALRQLLEIQAQVGVINELLEDVRFCLGKSFDSLPPSTRQAIDSSLQTSYRAVVRSSRQAADLIGKLKLA
jgi:hypothetical protein